MSDKKWDYMNLMCPFQKGIHCKYSCALFDMEYKRCVFFTIKIVLKDISRKH